jgi:hypothetical protein
MQPLPRKPAAAPQEQPVCYDAVVVTGPDSRRLGFLQLHGDAVTAFDVVEQPIGVFADERSAVVAIWRHAHGQVQS